MAAERDILVNNIATAKLKLEEACRNRQTKCTEHQKAKSESSEMRAQISQILDLLKTRDPRARARQLATAEPEPKKLRTADAGTQQSQPQVDNQLGEMRQDDTETQPADVHEVQDSEDEPLATAGIGFATSGLNSPGLPAVPSLMTPALQLTNLSMLAPASPATPASLVASFDDTATDDGKAGLDSLQVQIDMMDIGILGGATATADSEPALDITGHFSSKATEAAAALPDQAEPVPGTIGEQTQL
jgi:hypothetical protein